MRTDFADASVEPLQEARRPRRLPPIRRFAMVLVIGCVVGVVALILTGGSSGNASSQLHEVRQACTQWLRDTADQSAPPTWCANMTSWMSDRMDDHPGMMATPAALRATCRQWAASEPSSVIRPENDRAAWCDEMVSWMQQNARQWGSWNGWMRHGPMMS